MCRYTESWLSMQTTCLLQHLALAKPAKVTFCHSTYSNTLTMAPPVLHCGFWKAAPCCTIFGSPISNFTLKTTSECSLVCEEWIISCHQKDPFKGEASEKKIVGWRWLMKIVFSLANSQLENSCSVPFCTLLSLHLLRLLG